VVPDPVLASDSEEEEGEEEEASLRYEN